ncbi:ATP-dependent zinc protease family protein [Pseudomaricurvus sp.]|uniref:ATP-dependent zinc protease family protein n=1 Tax=Pseudomaricurvus sp. TaxID=2004510 RepID=UPI003F6D670B
MAYKVLGVGVGMLFLTGCASFFSSDEQTTQQLPPDTLQCPVVEPVVCPELPPVPEVKPEPPKPETKEPVVSCPKSDGVNSKYHRLGQIEYVDIIPIGLRQKGRIDTGAETTSIDALDIVEFERDGRSWVQFLVKDRNTNETVELKAPIERTVLIKQHGEEDIRRHVVSLTLAIGDMKDEVEVTLADRENFEYPILIGRNFLQGRALVDVSRKFLSLE